MRVFGISALSALLIASSAQCASAAELDLLFNGTGSGKIGNTTFTNTLFGFVLVTDTSDVFSPAPGVFAVKNLGGTFIVDANDYTLAATNQVILDTGSPDGTVALFNAQATSSFTGSSADLASYDLRSSIGPVTFDNTSVSLGGDGFALTDGTTLTFTQGTTFSSFQTFVDTGSGVPESGTWIMLLSGLGLLGYLVRIRENSSAVA
jgi:hypothetical protein